MYHKKIVLLLITCAMVEIVPAQQKFKIGENSFAISKNTALEVDSKTKGFLPPRMTKIQRTAIDSPVAGLIVWCTDCSSPTNPPGGGELCIYTAKGWLSFPFTAITTAGLTTGKMSDTNKPKRESAASATISGTLKEVFGLPPVETGIVYREIIDNDFATLPVLDATTGEATAPAYKISTPTAVTAVNGEIKLNISLSSATGSKRPYYFRTYAKSPLGISYGNTVIFNCADPLFSVPEVINGNSLNPVFTGTLTVNAGTPPNTITGYGYCSSTAKTEPTIDKLDVDTVVLSNTQAGIAALGKLNSQLTSETFTADPVIAIPVTDYTVKAIATTYFRYYVTANGATAYSDVVSFTPAPNPVTGGTAVAAMTSVERISSPFTVGKTSKKESITVYFNVSRAGTYSFSSVAAKGATTGLSMLPTADTFALGNDQSVAFQISGTPATSTEGNIFTVPGVGGLSTGAIQTDGSRPGNMFGSSATCDKDYITAVEPVTSGTGQVWMDRNLGASRAGIASPDSNPTDGALDLKAFGCLYQWGRGNDGHAIVSWVMPGAFGYYTPQGSVKGMTDTLSVTDSPVSALFITSDNDWRKTPNDKLWQGVDGINNPCPLGYRVPSSEEIKREIDAGTVSYNSPLKFVYAGRRLAQDYSSGESLVKTAGIGYYWTSTVVITPDGKHYSYFYSISPSGNTATVVTDKSNRAFGLSVRCIKD